MGMLDRFRQYAKQYRQVPPSLPRGGSFQDILRFKGSISKEDLARIRAVIEEDCETIDLSQLTTSRRI